MLSFSPIQQPLDIWIFKLKFFYQLRLKNKKNPISSVVPVIFPVLYSHIWASLVAQRVNNLPTMQETQVQLLGREDLLEKEMATNSSILAWRISWTEDLDRLRSMGSQESGMTQRLNHHRAYYPVEVEDPHTHVDRRS